MDRNLLQQLESHVRKLLINERDRDVLAQLRVTVDELDRYGGWHFDIRRDDFDIVNFLNHKVMFSCYFMRIYWVRLTDFVEQMLVLSSIGEWEDLITDDKLHRLWA